ncbi:MAG: KEOPS complex subunit Pcc1 [Methanosarcinaceae archaeon]|nr:KEOPS complex subunit Pcc1 [Methanosarcinaceae archaeon]MDD4332393.1 KEOPS complex subunit Pcc1 [Methanosarcinaceae archaeon]MDD4748469.1 KEOPS complex subunit Pcc1 [Methanosarcinaceae archaeon]
MKLKANFVFETEEAKAIYHSVLPELEDNFSERSQIALKLQKEPQSLVLNVWAEDVVSMRSALNTWFRLLQIAQEVAETTTK